MSTGLEVLNIFFGEQRVIPDCFVLSIKCISSYLMVGLISSGIPEFVFADISIAVYKFKNP